MNNAGNHQYITYFRAREPEVFYVEGTYSDIFLVNLKALVPVKARRWDGEKKRWEIQKEYLNIVKSCAKDCFDVVYYGEGGDYVKI
jgi:hypothetical protein